MPYPQTNVTAFDGMNVPTRADPTNWNERSEDGWARLKPGADEMNVLAGQMNVMADAANASAGAAAESAGEALQSRNAAEGFKDTAQQARDIAQGYRNEAEGFKNQAAASVDALTGVSTTPNVIGAGPKTWTGVGLAAKAFKLQQRLRAANPAGGEQWVEGTVTAYTSNGANSSLSINVTDVSSSAAGATVSNWSFTIAGIPGAQGATGGVTGGSLTGALNTKLGNAVPVSASPDIWSAGGDVLFLQGPGAITGFQAAPQAGARRTVIFTDTGVTIAGDANLVLYGGNQTLAAGDMLDVFAETTTKFRVTTRKRDGTPSVHNQGGLRNLRQFTTSGVFTAPKTGWYKITLVGGSGSAGVAAAPVGTRVAATGAGAGGLAVGMRYLTAGVTYIIAVGAGGVAVNASTNGSNGYPIAANGNDGSATSFSGSGITSMQANGGSGGLASTAAGVLAGGIGGTASGGDMNVKGGDGGTATAMVAGAAAASGGGAVGLQGGSFNGGAASASVAAMPAAAGGAGVGGNGGNATHTSGTGNPTMGAGGGAGGPGQAVTNGAAGQAQAGVDWAGVAGGQVSQNVRDARLNPLTEVVNGGGYGATSPTAGGGGAGVSFTGGAASRGGQFAGGGALAAGSAAGAYSSQPGGEFGGAPGGMALVAAAGQTPVANGTPGSSGAAWLEW